MKFSVKKFFSADKDAVVELEAVNIWEVRFVTPSRQTIIDSANEVITVKVFTSESDAEYYRDSIISSLENIGSKWKPKTTITKT